jgi:hypothetical protein
MDVPVVLGTVARGAYPEPGLMTPGPRGGGFSCGSVGAPNGLWRLAWQASPR